MGIREGNGSSANEKACYSCHMCPKAINKLKIPTWLYILSSLIGHHDTACATQVPPQPHHVHRLHLVGRHAGGTPSGHFCRHRPERVRAVEEGWKQKARQTGATTFALPSVSILLLWYICIVLLFTLGAAILWTLCRIGIF